MESSFSFNSCFNPIQNHMQLQPQKDPYVFKIPDGNPVKLTTYKDTTTTIYKKDDLIVIQPFELNHKKLKSVQTNLAFLIQEISKITNEYIDCSDDSIYIFIFMNTDETIKCMYKGIFTNNLLHLTPILVHKFTDHLKDVPSQIKLIKSWFGVLIKEMNSYTNDILNRIAFQIILYHINGLSEKSILNVVPIKEKEITNIYNSPYISKYLLVLNSLLLERKLHVPKHLYYYLTCYEFTLKFNDLPDNKYSLTCGIENLTYNISNLFSS